MVLLKKASKAKKKISNKEKQEAELKNIVQDIHAENSKLIAGAAITSSQFGKA